MQFDTITYSPRYRLQTPLIDAEDLAKLVQAIHVHGYRGPSKQKHNGVVPIRPTDGNLLKDYFNFLQEIDDQELQLLLREGTPVKVVAHVPDGYRLLGSMYKIGTATHLYILGISNYSHSLRA